MMNAFLSRLICIALFAVTTHAALAEGQRSAISVKDGAGALELSNLEDEGVAVEAGERQQERNSSSAAVAEGEPAPPVSGERLSRIEKAKKARKSRSDGKDSSEEDRDEEKVGGLREDARDREAAGELSGVANAVGVGSNSTGSNLSPAYAGGATGNGAAGNSPSGGSSGGGTSGTGSTGLPVPASDYTPASVAQNPRQALPESVPYTGSAAGQDSYRNSMVSQAANSAMGVNAVDNPAAVRRYLAVDRSTYMRVMGK